MMLEPKQKAAEDEAATRVYPDMPTYVGCEDGFLAAVDVGIVDLDAGRTVSCKDVADEFRRNYSRA